MVIIIVLFAHFCIGGFDDSSIAYLNESIYLGDETAGWVRAADGRGPLILYKFELIERLLHV